MPLWLGLIVGACCLVVWLAIIFYGLAAMALILVGRLAHRGWRAWRRRSGAGPAPS